MAILAIWSRTEGDPIVESMGLKIQYNTRSLSFIVASLSRTPLVICTPPTSIASEEMEIFKVMPINSLRLSAGLFDMWGGLHGTCGFIR
ncbi:hypothetical protein E2C01_015760 [Portunus trituberculatus]|uniref:Uncharacterized protein n=1 Tax=Portunus trituberculatus TaxID=210409 RepID=A0A5B7DNV1_PORTR|nr:hypothetical protein [Portunus trituberculatus]